MGAALALAAAGTAQAAATPAQVVHAWSNALNANHNARDGESFAHNARVILPGIDGLLNRMHSRLFNHRCRARATSWR